MSYNLAMKAARKHKNAAGHFSLAHIITDAICSSENDNVYIALSSCAESAVTDDLVKHDFAVRIAGATIIGLIHKYLSEYHPIEWNETKTKDFTGISEEDERFDADAIERAREMRL